MMIASDENNGNRLALVIGSGGLKCAAALGLWKVLLREGINIDLFAGCSGGSLYAAGMALNCDLDNFIEMTFSSGGLRSADKLDWLSILRAIMPRLFRFNVHFGILDDKRLLDALHTLFGDKTFADTYKPLKIVATDIHSGEQVELSEGKLSDAIRASGCVPFILPAWPVGGRLLVDGALSNPMPVDVAIKEGMDVILAMGFENPYPKSIKSLRGFADHLSSVMVNNLFNAHFGFDSLVHHSEIIHILPEFDRPISLSIIDQIPYIVEQGEQAAEAQIPYLHRLLESVSKQNDTQK
ncbi:MAG: patatin-like phospholipase family protein [bacterium]|nr:patatin-like phospholipase family protein [bacterium]